MSDLWQLLHGTTPSWKELVDAARSGRGLYLGLGAVIGLITNGVAAPYEDDLHFSLKALLVVLLAAEGFVLPVWFPDEAGLIITLAGIAAVALLMHACVYWIWGVHKILPYRRGFLRRGEYKRVRVLGGLVLRPDARSAMAANNRELQDYFADRWYRQTDLWPPWSLAVVRAMAFVTYVVGVAAIAGTLLLIAKA